MNNLLIVRMGAKIDPDEEFSEPFDVDATVTALLAMRGVSDMKRNTPNERFECSFEYGGSTNIVRLDKGAEAISIYGTDEDSLFLAMELQRALGINLRIFDTCYTFDLAVGDFRSLKALLRAIEAS